MSSTVDCMPPAVDTPRHQQQHAAVVDKMGFVCNAHTWLYDSCDLSNERVGVIDEQGEGTYPWRMVTDGLRVQRLLSLSRYSYCYASELASMGLGWHVFFHEKAFTLFLSIRNNSFNLGKRRRGRSSLPSFCNQFSVNVERAAFSRDRSITDDDTHLFADTGQRAGNAKSNKKRKTWITSAASARAWCVFWHANYTNRLAVDIASTCLSTNIRHR